MRVVIGLTRGYQVHFITGENKVTDKRPPLQVLIQGTSDPANASEGRVFYTMPKLVTLLREVKEYLSNEIGADLTNKGWIRIEYELRRAYDQYLLQRQSTNPQS